MKRSSIARSARLARSAFALLVAAVSLAAPARGAEKRAAARPPVMPSADALSAREKETLSEWLLSQPAVRAVIAGHRTRVLRVWSHLGKGASGFERRVTLLLRDYDEGVAREVRLDSATGRIEIEEVAAVQPSVEEMEEGMAIVRRDPALAALVENRDLTLMGGFHNRSPYADDPCSKEVCLEFAFMRPGWVKGPARYVIVNLSRRQVAHHDFRARPGEPRPRMTEATSTP